MYVISKGNEFNPASFKNWTKEKFYETYAGVVDADLETVWNEIIIINESTESNNELAEEDKPFKRKKYN